MAGAIKRWIIAYGEYARIQGTSTQDTKALEDAWHAMTDDQLLEDLYQELEPMMASMDRFFAGLGNRCFPR